MEKGARERERESRAGAGTHYRNGIESIYLCAGYRRGRVDVSARVIAARVNLISGDDRLP